MDLLNELYRIKQIMGLNTINESIIIGIDEIIKRVFGVSDNTSKEMSSAGQDVLKKFIGRSGSYDDIADYINKEFNLSKNIENVVEFIKSQPEIIDTLVRTFDVYIKKSSDEIFRELNLKEILTTDSYNDIEALMQLPITKNNKDTVIKFIDDAITTLNQKKGSNPNIDQLLKKLEDRKKFAESYNNINPNFLSDLKPDFTPSKEAESFLENLAYTNKSFIQMISGKPMSGWKIHIYGDDVEDSVYLITKLDDFLKSQNTTYKIATDKFYKNSKGTIQQGKGLTIYIPYDIVKQGKQRDFFEEINSRISDYKKSGTIQGDRSYNDKIHYRYEYNKPFDALPENGVTISDANKYYVDNQGDYMSGTGNLQPDLFDRVSSDSTIKVTQDLLKGNRISNRSFSNGESVNWDKITNAKNMEDYNKVIAKAIQTGDYSTISRGGFENYGVDNFREYLINNIERVNDLDPVTGRWSVTFK